MHPKLRISDGVELESTTTFNIPWCLMWGTKAMIPSPNIILKPAGLAPAPAPCAEWSSQWHLRTLGKSSQIQDLPLAVEVSTTLLDLGRGPISSDLGSYVLNRRPLHRIRVWYLGKVSLSRGWHQEGIPLGGLSSIAFDTQGGILQVGTRPYPVCENAHTNRHWGGEGGREGAGWMETPHKEVCIVDNSFSKFHMLISYHLGLWLIACTKSVVQRIAIA